MRILAAADLHGDHDICTWLVQLAKKTRAEVVVLAGDLLGAKPGHDGSIEEAHRADATAIVDLLAAVEVPVFYVMGNDDMVELEPRVSGIQSVHNRRIELGGFNFVGYQYSLPFMGGIHEKPEEEIREDLAGLASLVDGSTILVTHSPAYGVLDLGIPDRHAGSRAILDVVVERNPVGHIHGHIHSQFGRADKHFNVAAAGHKRGILLDLRTMTHEVVQEDAHHE